MTKVLVLHNVCLVRSALAALLRSEGNFEVTSAGWRAAARQAEFLRPDVAVVDLECPGVSAALLADAGTVRLLPRSATPLLVLARADTPGSLRRAFQRTRPCTARAR
ncbi:hypothetical protein [Streptomyces sp. NPDC048551]|uniref:hypothetical protein n=1 Tax=Streptomyces sp. NPDC048551 TaxID=3155758 RepID=UPI00343DF493